jgi:membrane-associated phospholipid phosphatase
MWAKLVSYIIHPAIVPVLGVIIAKFTLPYHIPDQLFYFVALYVFAGTYVFPLFIVIGLYKLNFVQSIHLKTAKERFYPFLVSALFYFLTAKAVLQFHFPIELSKFIFAGCAIIATQFILLKTTKVSAHASAASAMLTWLICLSFDYNLNMLFLIAMATLALGVVSSARLYLKAHSPSQIITGIGIVALAVIVFYWS